MEDSDSETLSIGSFSSSDTEDSIHQDEDGPPTSTPIWIVKSRRERQKIIFEPEPYESEDIFFSVNTT